MARQTTKKGEYPKSPYDWYVEQQWVTEALIKVQDSHWATVWDPACGQGSVLKAVDAFGVPTWSTDIQFRGHAASGIFYEIDFVGDLDFVRSAAPVGRYTIVSNTPYSYVKGILEAFVRRAMELDAETVAFLMPIGRQAGENRHALWSEFPPTQIWIMSERPSMPPGAQIAALGDKAYKRGRLDFMWVVWDRRNPAKPGETKWGTIAPREKAVADV